MGVPPLPFVHKRCFLLPLFFLKDKSDGVKIVPVIFVHETGFMVSIEVVEDVLPAVLHLLDPLLRRLQREDRQTLRPPRQEL